MDISSLVKLKASLKHMMQVLEKIDDLPDKDIQEAVEDWVRKS